MSNQINTFLDTSIGPKFLHIDSADLEREFRAALVGFGTQFEPMRNRTGTEMIISAKLADLSFTHEDSLYTPTVFARNRNDGGTACSVGLGLYRFICMNGLYFGVGIFQGRVVHRDSARTVDFLEQLPILLKDGIEHITSGTLEATITEASSIKVLDPIDVIGSLPQLTDRQKESAIMLAALGTGRAGDRASDAWGLYNLVNEAVRKRSRSALASANRDMGLLDDISALAAAQSREAA